MKDILGQQLNVGDKVVFPYSDTILEKGVIVKICKEQVKIRIDRTKCKKLRYPYYVMKYDENIC